MNNEKDARSINKESLERLIKQACDQKKWILLRYYGVKYTPKELKQEIMSPNGSFFNSSNYELVEPTDVEHVKKEFIKMIDTEKRKIIETQVRVLTAWDIEDNYER